MKRLLLTLAIATLAIAALPASAGASFGLYDYDVTFANEDGTPATQAGSHPFAMTTSLGVNFSGTGSAAFTEGRLKDLLLEQVPGLVADTTAYPRCSTVEFVQVNEFGINDCPLETAVGVTANSVTEPGNWFSSPVFNVSPPPGVLVRLGFRVAGLENIIVDVGLGQDAPNLPLAASRNTPVLVHVYGNRTQLWGDPSDPGHDELRGQCGVMSATGLPPGDIDAFELKGDGDICPVGDNPKPLLTLPTSCSEPLLSSYEVFSWEGASGEEDGFDSGSVLTHDAFGNPQSLSGCGKLPFHPSIGAIPTSKAATSPTGLDFSLEVKDEGLTSTNEGATAASDIRKVEVTLPEGMSANPSLAEGLEVCSEADLDEETLSAAPGEGCPEASKIGSLEVESPLVEEAVKGSLYQATPYENPFDSLLAFYIVFKNPKLGIIVKQPAKVISDPSTGQLTTITDEIPQLPFSAFRLHFREGTRSPLITPPSCGTHAVKAVLYPWSGTTPVSSTSSFELISGPDAGRCPKGGLPPFHPSLVAGTTNNAAGRFSPFNVRISRTDSEQEITHFSIKLPPGLAGKLAGVSFCSDSQIAAAKARTGPLGGHEELETPSCPAASQVGRTLAGSGVGPSLAYAPGKVYLAGPFHGTPISLVSITSAVVGPFDIGTVVVRLAIEVNPETGEVFLDSAGSDPIPHIIKGIPIHLRDIRAYTDRPQFTFNPTSCTRKSTAATVLGGGLDFASEADDNPFVSTSPFQAADCAALPFEPKLTLKLIGGTRRGAHPALRAFLRMRGFGEAGVARAQVTLPRSEFIENAHFNTICTRVQFKAAGGNGEACPRGSIYGFARAKTPVLAEPLEGPVYLRSSEHELPDVVASLKGQQIDVHLVGHVDSVKGQLRSTFETVPDAPVEWASFSFQGAKKGLFVNSTNLCAKKNRADVRFTGQNGKRHNYRTAVKVKCKGRRRQGK
jgi:hypothetical protein